MKSNIFLHKKEYINKVEKNPQAYNQALESYKLQKNISTTPYMYKGKEYTLGGTLNKNRVIQNFKKEFKRRRSKTAATRNYVS